MEAVEGGLAGLDAVRQLAPGRPAPGGARPQRGGPQRARRIAPQAGPHRGEAVAAVAIFGEHPEGRQRTQEAVERGGVGCRRLRQLADGPWPVGEQIRDPQLRRDRQHRHAGVLQEPLPQRGVGGRVVWLVLPSVMSPVVPR